MQIEQLACCEPAGIGLELTHWSTRSLAEVAMQQGILRRLSHSTVALILQSADLQPHRSRYWKTSTLNEQFRQRASRVLWCYEQAWNLAEKGEIVLCLDEMANLQVHQRRLPTRPMLPGRIEQQEHEYIRHGVVNFLASLEVTTGRMWGRCLDRNDSLHLMPALHALFHRYRRWKKIHVIWDAGPSHTSQQTTEFLRSYQPWVRTVLTPAHASWLNQAELLLRAFVERYVKRGEWSSRRDFQRHLLRSWPEYNRLFAHPFDWSWTRADLRSWLARHVDD